MTGAVQDAVQSVSNAFDLPRQIDRHPWLFLGGSFVCGCLAVEYFARSARRPRQTSQTTAPPGLAADNAEHGNGETAPQPVASAAALTAAYESGARSSSWQQLRSIAIGAVIGIVQDVAARAVPQVISYLNSNRAERPAAAANNAVRQDENCRNQLGRVGSNSLDRFEACRTD